MNDVTIFTFGMVMVIARTIHSFTAHIFAIQKSNPGCLQTCSRVKQFLKHSYFHFLAEFPMVSQVWSTCVCHFPKQPLVIEPIPFSFLSVIIYGSNNAHVILRSVFSGNSNAPLAIQLLIIPTAV